MQTKKRKHSDLTDGGHSSDGTEIRNKHDNVSDAGASRPDWAHENDTASGAVHY